MPSAEKKKTAFCLSLVLVMGVIASLPTPAYAQYKQVNLVSDLSGIGRYTDPNLRNGWGLAFLPGSPWWVSDNDTGFSSLYDGAGHILPLLVTIPPAIINPYLGPTGSPTGLVANTTQGFVVSSNGNQGPAQFLFSTEDGTVSGWNPNVNATNAIIGYDNSANFPFYEGLAIVTAHHHDDPGDDHDGHNTFIYAADSANNKVDVYDSHFNPVTLAVGAFTDPNATKLGLVVYGIQGIDHEVYVSFASLAPQAGGIVDVFDTKGNLIRTAATNGPRGPLEGAWGMVIAPDDFGWASGKLLVGNVEDGHISVFNHKGKFVGQLKDRHGNLIAIDGLWGLAFGGGCPANGKRNHLYFAAGPNGYADGLFGVILPPED